MDIKAVNSMSYEEFIDLFGNAVEKCPLIAGAIWSKRPFTTFVDLETSIFEFIDSLPQTGKEGILRCLPDLAGRELQSGTLSAESQKEQVQAGLTSLSHEEQEKLHQFNSLYKNKLGFPFVIAARMSDKSKILQDLTARIQNPPLQELYNGIEEVKKICHLRLQDIHCKHAVRPTNP
ncbi:putative 2-oxo-4-hydroxy-4-carboxy-5-ureidoimidazoline decarboxylase [Rhinatrema bivittatum]|uniref:putative 2-oxo-4-hydroxy-4-carboxy-5-ureidoimidazoline decarboxylase n=1 Tax=Rhinatrema bivittatum TaxID=194408 RepID=UPI00112E0435|nr:putative 2-oxo-4-hydroxy-4-carboxy-5-ureidoimidazoline decarboxylase [Rhinatrema bivittatum]